MCCEVDYLIYVYIDFYQVLSNVTKTEMYHNIFL